MNMNTNSNDQTAIPEAADGRRPDTPASKKKSHKAAIILLILFLSVAAGLFAFPFVSDFFIKSANESMMTEWDKEVEANVNVFPNTGTRPDHSLTAEDLKEEKLHSPLYRALLAYNESLDQETQNAAFLHQGWQQAAVDLSAYGFTEPVFGSLTVESLGITYPIYLGATDSNMLKGVTHLYGTSVPVGGAGTHCVICGHCGMMRTEMFRHLDRVKEGDTVKIKNPWETLTYKVTEIIVVEPNDYSRLLIEDGKDLLTLITCYP